MSHCLCSGTSKFGEELFSERKKTLGPPVVPTFTPFLVGRFGSPTKIDVQNKVALSHPFSGWRVSPY